jgi:hypothetical protein
MKRVTVVDRATGLAKRRLTLPACAAVERSIEEGETWVEGHIDPLSQRLDLASGKVVDYQPPAPDENHLWNATAKRWQKSPERVELERASRLARAEIEKLEASQLRPLRELAVDPNNEKARERLNELETRIAELRPLL